MNTITGYEFAAADNDAHLPSATGAQNEALIATPLDEGEPEDAMLVASGLLPRLVAQAKVERLE